MPAFAAFVVGLDVLEGPGEHFVSSHQLGSTTMHVQSFQVNTRLILISMYSSSRPARWPSQRSGGRFREQDTHRSAHGSDNMSTSRGR